MRYGIAMFEFVAPGWSSGPVHPAGSFWERWRGIRVAPEGTGVLIPGQSVHGFRLATPVRVVGLDRNDCVLQVATLQPGRLVGCRGAAAMLELQMRIAIPPVGAYLVRVPRVR